MENNIHKRYTAARQQIPNISALTLLHIGAEESLVVIGDEAELKHTLALSIGSIKTSRDFFKNSPPTPLELENAIMTVEDEVTRVYKVTAVPSTLLTTDSDIRAIARIAGIPEQPLMDLSVELVEQIFDRLASLSLGRPITNAEIPNSPTFAATVLILREFMHHLQFKSILITNW